MELVDILARDLKEWPPSFASYAVASSHGANKKIKYPVWFCLRKPYRGDGGWCDIGEVGIILDEKPEDQEYAIVTRTQWQAAVDALKARDQAWDGEGLPPVGTICEFRVETDYWRQCEVIAHKDGSAICWIHCNKIFSTSGAAIRPIRTAEQIAEQEHREAVEALAAATDWILTREACEAVLAAGYRKQEVQQ